MIYYIDSLYGDDNNPGTSEKEPLKSLARIEELKLGPGDQVLLKRGSVFEDESLVITASGTKGNPIVFTSYGTGPLPRIDTNGHKKWYLDYGCSLDAKTHVSKGYISSSVLLYDAQFVTVENIEVTNKEVDGLDVLAPHRMNRTGVAIVAKDGGTLHDITIRSMYVHHIHGNVYDKHLTNGGIYAVCLTPDDETLTGVARFDGLLIENNTVTDSFRWGIAAGYTYKHGDYLGASLNEETFLTSGHTDMVVRNNYVERIGGDGITTMYALRPDVSHNTLAGVAMHMNSLIYKYPEDRKGMVAAGVWPWKCKDAVFRYNEVLDTRLNQDGQAFDCDSGDGTLYEYNYSYGNEGGSVMFCMEEAVNNVFRKNVSVYDLTGIITPADNPDALVEENNITLLGDTPLIRSVEYPGEYELVNNTIKNE